MEKTLEEAAKEFTTMLEKSGLSDDSILSMLIGFGYGYGAAESKSDIVKEIKVVKLLDTMITNNRQLYEQILDTDGFAYYFNELIKLAKK